jgi:hypothetical protein
MIEHLERVVQRTLELVGGGLPALTIGTVILLVASACLALSLYKFDRESCLVALADARRGLSRGWGWILVALALLLQVYGLNELHSGVIERLNQEQHSRYIVSQEPSGLPTSQRAPQVSYLDTTQFVQKIVMPSDLTIAQNVTDQITRDGNVTMLTRTTTQTREVPMKLSSSDVDVKLGFKSMSRTGNRQVYQAELNAKYAVQNPFADARRIHFNFPLPDNSGTLSGFHFKVNGVERPAQDISRGLEWEGDLKPQETVKIEIGYTHLGAGSWAYDLAGRREPIADFHLLVHCDSSDYKFLRGSLFATRVTGDTLEWTLRNQITSQSISLYFPAIPTEQIVGNLFVWAPVAVLLFALMVVVWARLTTGTTAWRTCLGCLACCGGYTLASYLVGYVPLLLALSLSFGISAGLCAQALGRELWLPIVASTLAPFCFLLAGNTGLLLTSLGLVTLALIIVQTREQGLSALPGPGAGHPLQKNTNLLDSSGHLG